MKKKSLFNISYNVRSISSIGKFNEFKTLISKLPKLPNVISIQETWFRENLLKIYDIPGYKPIHCCRKDGYGGVSLYIRDNLEYKVEKCDSQCFIESIVLNVNSVKINNKPLKIIAFYRSQKCDTRTYLRFIEEALVSFGRNPCIVFGDANIDVPNGYISFNLVELLSLFDFANCHRLVTRPESKTSIDHVYSNIPNLLYIDAVEAKLSDHNLVHCRLELVHNDQLQRNVVRSYCDYDSMVKGIEDDILGNIETGDPSADTEKLISIIDKAITISTHNHLQTSNLRDEITPWINRNLSKLKNYKENLLTLRRKKPKTVGIEEKLKRISKIIKEAYNTSMNFYYTDNLENIKHQPSKSWAFLNKTLGRNQKKEINIKDSDGNPIVDDKQKAEAFNNYFLQSIIDLKAEIQHFPDDNFNMFSSVTRHEDSFQLSNTTPAEIEHIITHLSLRKSPGFDNVSATILRKCRHCLTQNLVNIFNSMINTGVYPSVLKMHKVTPIPKENNASSVDKFRPIAVLSIINNIFERIIFNQISTYFDEKGLLSGNQYGFRKCCGTEEAAINVVNCICKCLDDGNVGAVGVFYDFTKAFDLIDHNILLEKLWLYGIRGKEYSIIENYISLRRQFVEINGQRSSIGLIEYGVPQGSVLGPLLFKIFINDISNLELNGKMFIYADDICVIYPFQHETVAKAYIEHDAAVICEFARVNKLFINAQKTKIIRFKPYSYGTNFSMFVDGKEIVEVESLKYLGLHLQSNLSWDTHIRTLRTKLSQAVGLLYKFKNKFNKETKFLIYQALIQSNLNYLIVLYGFKKTNEFKALQRTQNKALKIVGNLPIRTSTVSLYTDNYPDVLPIYGQYQLQLLMYVFKCMHNIGYHTIKFSLNQNLFNTRHSNNLKVPICRLNATKQRIEYMGSSAYNNLPQSIKIISRISEFKNSLKQVLHENIAELI